MARRIADAQGPNHNPWLDGALLDGPLITTSTIGTVTTTATTSVAEYGDDVNHVTVLTLTDFAVGTSGDNVALAIGASLYTLPAGDLVIENTSFTGTITASISDPTTTGEIGLGTTVGSGANATLGAVAAGAENILGPIVVTGGEFDGAEVFSGASAPTTFILAADGHVIYFNIAATWADVTAAGAVTATGTVTIKWRKAS